MSLKLFGWILIVSALAPYALLVYQLRSRVSLAPRSGRASIHLAARLRESGSLLRHVKRDGGRGTLTIAAAVFLVVAGAGFAKSYFGQAPDVSDETMAASRSSDAGDPGNLADGDLEQLADYARSVATASPAATDGKTQPDAATLLPDVNTMIERLAARLASAPDDVQGWRTLGWSYVNTGRYDDAVKAYAKAVALDPNSPEIARLYEDAKAKASGGAGVASATDATTTPSKAAQPHEPAGTPPHDTNAAIRSMVDGLANRLASAPRDVEGWTRLMRSRVVLGERGVAAEAFAKALEIFKDDSAASAQVTAMAAELGLTSE